MRRLTYLILWFAAASAIGSTLVPAVAQVPPTAEEIAKMFEVVWAPGT